MQIKCTPPVSAFVFPACCRRRSEPLSRSVSNQLEDPRSQLAVWARRKHGQAAPILNFSLFDCHKYLLLLARAPAFFFFHPWLFSHCGLSETREEAAAGYFYLFIYLKKKFLQDLFGDAGCAVSSFRQFTNTYLLVKSKWRPGAPAVQ